MGSFNGFDSMIKHWREQRPDALALVGLDIGSEDFMERSWAQFDEDIDAVARYWTAKLKEVGVHPGGVVTLWYVICV